MGEEARQDGRLQELVIEWRGLLQQQPAIGTAAGGTNATMVVNGAMVQLATS